MFAPKRYPLKNVYLAGPISGLSYNEARFGWREEFAKYLPPHINPVSPMRAKEFLTGETCIKGDALAYTGEHVLATPSGVLTRDYNDVLTCDAMTACFLGVEKVSQGTCIEFGWAYAHNKPVVMVAEPDNIHQHVLMAQIAGYITPSLEEAALIVRHILTPNI